MFQIIKKLHIDYYDYIYFFMMVIYMSHMTLETRVMLGGVREHPIAFIIPIVLTLILLNKHKIPFNNIHLLITIIILVVWSILQLVAKNQYRPIDFANYIYFVYAIIIAYIHVRVYKKKMFYLYEDVMVKLSLLSLIIWIFTNIAPGAAMQVARLFPETSHGYNFLYLIHWISPKGIHVIYGLTRNAGCSWEPGRFAIMISLAILFNIYRCGVKFRNNKNIIVLLITLLTTMSTSGYVLTFLIYAYMTRINMKNILLYVLLGLLLIYGGTKLVFIGDKLEQRMQVKSQIETLEEQYQWHENQTEGKRLFFMDRFPSMYHEFINFIHDPILGYGSNLDDSYFSKHVTNAVGFTGGLMTVFSKFGIFIAIPLLYILYLSSLQISTLFHSKKKYGLLICFVTSMISYPLIQFPIYTAIWLYSLFIIKKTDRIKIKSILTNYLWKKRR